MKYKLKRDLPFAEAGTKVTSNDGGELVRDDYYAYVVNRSTGGIAQLGLVKKLISEGWIEVKPREWWVITSSRSGTMACDDYKKACDLADELLGNQNTEIIKVREVIE